MSEFSQETDINHIYGEENIFRYLPLKSVGFRIQDTDRLDDIQLILLAADTTGTPLFVSISGKNKNLKAVRKAVASLPGIKIIVQREQSFIRNMHKYERIRTCSRDLSDAFYAKAAKLGKHIANNKPLIEGRLELMHYLKEQSIASEYHRYGSIFGEDK
jgi:RHH-type proline utilization regulon transcriptional repressor/proline dehydrogenase/delta 1-pyrroline-5-carboxylate dehydrogenase